MIKLGQKVKDKLTGFQGIAMARTTYLSGCVTIGILPLKLKQDGFPNDWMWLDEHRLIGVDEKGKTGGPANPSAPAKN